MSLTTVETLAMSFKAINVYEDELDEYTVEHTREIQIEEGYKVFRNALDCQKDGDLEKADEFYRELFKIEVMKLEAEESPPAADKLKYLASKNYAFLLLSLLKTKIHELDEEAVREELDDIFKEISDALLYEAEEPAFLQFVYELSKQLGYNREARLALESIAYSDQRAVDLQDAFEVGESVSLQDYKHLINLRDLLRHIGDTSALEHNVLMKGIKDMELNPMFKSVEADYSWITNNVDLRHSLERLIELENSRVLEITLTSKDWLSVIAALNDKVWALSTTKRKIVFDDIYSYSGEPVISVKFKLPQGLTEASDRMEETNANPTQSSNSTPVPDDEPNSKKRRRKSEFLDGGHRSSKRVRAMDQPLGTNAADEQEFFDDMNKLLDMVSVKFSPVLPAMTNQDYAPGDQPLVDFKSLLQSWDDTQAEVFLKKEIVPNRTKKAGQPVMQMLDFAALGDTPPSKPSLIGVKDGVDNYLRHCNEKGYHIQEARMAVLQYLLTDNNGKIAFVEDRWPDQLLRLVRRTVEACEIMLYLDVKQRLDSADLKTIELAQSICEIYVDAYIKADKQLRAPGKSTKEVRELEHQRETYLLRRTRWIGLCGDLLAAYQGTGDTLSLQFRHEWVTITTYDDPNDSISLLQNCLESLQNSPIAIEFVNCSDVPVLSMESINTQISKYRAASVFSKVFEQCDEETNQHQRMATLEAILMPNTSSEPIPEQEAITQFMETASLDFRLQLWYLLLDAYDAAGRSVKSFDGYLRILVSSIEEFSEQKGYRSVSSETQRSTTLLRSLNVCLEILRKLVKLAMDDETVLDELDSGLRKEGLESVLQLLRVLRVYVLFDDAIINNSVQAPQHASWDRAAKQFKELVVRAWSLLYLFYKKSLSSEDLEENEIALNDILSMIHNEVGSRYYCGIGDGFFLKLSLREIAKIDNDEDTEWEMLQCLHCRYAFTLGKEPYDHHATPVNLNRDESLELVGFVMKVILSKKNIIQTLQRTDVRATLEELYGSLEATDSKKEKEQPQDGPIAQNRQKLKTFMGTIVTPRFLKTALSGGLVLDLFKCNNEAGKIGESGLYYIQGLTRLIQYRQRASKNTANYDDVDAAIESFTADLVCNTNRFESWLGLAECYDASANLDLSINANMINSPELRPRPVNNQRQSIVACSMAISVFLKNGLGQGSKSKSKPFLAKQYQQQQRAMFPLYARILYQASRSPMNMEAFATKERLLIRDGDVYRKSPEATMSKKLVWKTANYGLQVALNDMGDDEVDWHVYFLHSKVLNKLAMYEEALDAVSKSMEAAGRAELEPTYKLVSMTYKYVRSGKIDVELGMQVLTKNTHFGEDVESADKSIQDEMPDTRESEFYFLCVHILQRIKQADKRKDLHRPSYRLAKIFDEVYHTVHRAKEEMSPFFNKGSTAKPISIWKNETERPGRHYELMHQYIVYYTSLLERTLDSAQLGGLLRRLRRYNGSMAKKPETWDAVCTATARAAKRALGIPLEGFSDKLIMVIPSEVFDNVATEMNNELMQGTFKSTITLDWITYADDKKKVNNGYGSTSMIDDMFVSIYLQIYCEYADQRPEQLKTAMESASMTNLKPLDATTATTAPASPAPAPSTPKSPATPQGNPETTTTTTTTSPAVKRSPNSGKLTNSPSKPQPSVVEGASPEILRFGWVKDAMQYQLPPKNRVTRKLILTKGRDLVRLVLENGIKDAEKETTKDGDGDEVMGDDENNDAEQDENNDDAEQDENDNEDVEQDENEDAEQDVNDNEDAEQDGSKNEDAEQDESKNEDAEQDENNLHDGQEDNEEGDQEADAEEGASDKEMGSAEDEDEDEDEKQPEEAMDTT